MDGESGSEYDEDEDDSVDEEDDAGEGVADNEELSLAEKQIQGDFECVFLCTFIIYPD